MDKLRCARAKASNVFHRGLFDTSYKTRMHYIQLGLVLGIIALTGGRIVTKPKSMPVSRTDTLAIVMGIKTFIVLSYQIVTTHVDKCRRWRNLKTYLVLNSLEVLFWFVVVIINFMGITTYCKAAYCGLSWISVLFAMVLTTFATWTAIVTRRLQQEETSLEGKTRVMNDGQRQPGSPNSARPFRYGV